MQRTLPICFTRVMPPVLGLISLCLTISGCTQFRQQLADVLTADLDHQAYRDTAAGGVPGAQQDEHEPYRIRQATQDHADRLTQALQRQEPIESAALSPGQEVPQVHWIDPAPTQTIAPGQPKHHIAMAEKSMPRPSNDPAPVASQIMSQPSTPTLARRSYQDRAALLDQLLDHIRSGDGLPMDKALTAAAISLADPGKTLDTDDLSSLQPTKRRSVQRYHQLVVSLAQELAARDGELDADTIADRINNIFGERPIHIGKVELCRSVRGYGVYEPFESSVFLAGREHTMIVYVELDHFRVQQDAANHNYQVRLAQELVLYNEPDGLAVWQQPRVDIVDESRNRRRDFFVVQMIRIPARLGVGKYRLKVRMTDLNSGTLDELTIPIQLVADQALVGGGVK